MSILVITTGGTIGAEAYPDPIHPPKISIMPAEGMDPVRDILSQDFKKIDTRCVSLEPRDSKDIDCEYRNSLLATIKQAAEIDIVITHGSDTMLDTAKFLYDAFDADTKLAVSKTIILTGAMTPFANGTTSDGYKNLTFSFQRLRMRQLETGRIYIVLCDGHAGAWEPQLYDFRPGKFQKAYETDGRYNHLISMA